jgi:uncharacterized protein (TIGR02266 family)
VTPVPEPSASRLLFESRRDLAVPIAVEVFRRDGEAALEYATNLSPGGVCLHARLRLTVGEDVTVAFALPGEAGRIRAHGRVTWREDDDPRAEARFLETGVRFEVVDEADRERITRFVRELERA